MARPFVSFRYGAKRLACKGIAAIWLVSAPFAAAAEPVVVAALGDSLTAGYGLPRADGFVPQMQAWLTEQGVEVEVRNAGVSGDTTAGGLSRVDWTLTDDVDAMIVALGGNDLLRGLDPAVSRRNLDGILQAAKAKDVPVLLVGVAASMNYGADYKAAFDGMYAELSAQYETLLYPDFFRGLAELPDREVARREHLQGDGIHPDASGVEILVEAMGPSVLELVRQAQ
ncbi:arylesterase [Vannielia sp.]|uniref:arylesterase n=1 Tax=Vannielia sp. TaxID=2813045 RepID=UPI00261DB161|nr:arylesterase [Vannielia sp.]MDF1871751.1 arylesterase [Vannielia sp.]